MGRGAGAAARNRELQGHGGGARGGAAVAGAAGGGRRAGGAQQPTAGESISRGLIPEI